MENHTITFTPPLTTEEFEEFRRRWQHMAVELTNEGNIRMTKRRNMTHDIHIVGRRWFQRSAGNTYHTACVYIDGELKYKSGKHYGYGEQFLESGTAMLVGTEFVPADFTATQSTYK